MQLRDITANEYRLIYSHMKRDFPPGERPPFHSVKRSFEKRVYDGFFLIENETEAGYAIITAPPENDYAFITFLAIHPEMRGRGLGGEFLELIKKHHSERSLVLEVEDPAAAKTPEQNSVCVRRIGFYERSGFRVLKASSVTIFGVKMLIMTNSEKDPISVRGLLHSVYSPALGSGKLLRFIDVID